jgi:magnesium chelatase subunit D
MSTNLQLSGPKSGAALAACLLAVDPPGLGGLAIRSAYGPAVEYCLRELRRLLPISAPFRRMPLHVADGRLLGGLDLTTTLQAGRPVFERGLFAEADGGCLVLPTAERLTLAMAARLCSVLDDKEVAVERDGFGFIHVSRVAVVALDEGVAEDERPPAALLDRLALHLNLEGSDHREKPHVPFSAEQIGAARAVLPAVIGDDAMLDAFCRAAAMIGIGSPRAPMFAMRVARIHAALAGRTHVSAEDAVIASRLVLAPRATALPVPPDASGAESAADNPQCVPDSPNSDAGDEGSPVASGEMKDIVVAAIRAAVPFGLLAQLQIPTASRSSSSRSGGAGALHRSGLRGRPVGTRRGELKAGARLNVVETLRAAAPWQKLRQKTSEFTGVRVRRDDFRITQFKRRSESAMIFVVDGSGSSALHRLAEAKGAVELLLSDCYIRRDQVALIAFRGQSAELILPPTRSLARAKRALSALPGGGGTPIAHALDAAGTLAHGLQRKGLVPMVVLLTDGRANIARDGKPGRERAEADALAAARMLRKVGLATLLIDIAPRPHVAAERLATEMGARYLPLPDADAGAISRAVQAVALAESA